jgi:integrase
MKMNQKIKFYLDKVNSKGTAFIFIRYHCKDGYLRYSTKQSVKPDQWDAKASLPTEIAVLTEISKIGQVLQDFLDLARLTGRSTLYIQDLTKELNHKLQRTERGQYSHFFTSVDNLIDLAERGEILTPKNTMYTLGSIKNLKKTRNRLFEFNPNLEFSSISMDSYQAFVNWCNKKNYTLNYISALIKDWKTFMNLGLSKNLHRNYIHKNKDFKRITEDSYQVYLNDIEIKQLYDLDLSNDQYRENLRDRFIVNLYTGLRISDMQTLTIKNFNIEGDIITHINKKTGKTVAMPVHPLIKRIQIKYNGSLPKQYKDAVVNREIKGIAKKAGLTQTETFTQTKGGKKITVVKEKWEMIRTHTCRRSLCTNLLKKATILDVLPVMGMSLKTLEKYNKRSIQENARMLKNNAFYSEEITNND